ncbi:MAG: response regulator [Prevotella sp.]
MNIHTPNNKDSVNILIIEDHQIVLLGLSTLLSTCENIRRVDKALTGCEALELVRNNIYDLLIMDIELPDISGFELLDKIRSVRPQISVIFHSMHEEIWLIKRMMKSGANAIVLKSDNLEELLKAVKNVLEGKTYYSSRYKEYCTEYGSKEVLSKREQDVLKAIAEGKRTAEISEQLFVSCNTVEFHRKKLMRKLNATNMAELIKKAIEHGFLKF